MKRFVMRFTGEKSEVIYETRNAQKKTKKTKVYVYNIYLLPALEFIAPYSVIALPFSLCCFSLTLFLFD